MSHKSNRPMESDEQSKPTMNRNQGFSIGAAKKSNFQRHKEETELKKKKETEEAAKVYEDFVASFETRSYAQGTSGFVKSSKDRSTPSHKPPSPKSSYKPLSFVKAGDSKPATTTMTKSEKPNNKRSLHSTIKDNQDDEDDEDDDVLAQMKQAKAVKKRHMDSFLEEIKKGQENRVKGHDSSSSSSTGRDDTPGAHETSEPYTTNLFLSDLHPKVTEDILCNEFGKYGPIASVKVMWPRTGDEMDRQRNCGFVSFMTRKDAAAALDGVNGKDLLGHTMKAEWGKPVALPPRPVFVLEKHDDKVDTGHLPFNAKLVDKVKHQTEVIVIPPSDTNTIKIIHRLVERVVKCGPLFEELIMEKEINNPQYAFLFDNTHVDHIYYRWRLYSILQGDTISSWRTDPFQMFDGGEWWIPPEIPDVPFDEDGPMELNLDSEDEANERTQQRLAKGQLGKVGRRRYEIMLRQVTYQRGTIAQAMAFAIEHADAYEDIIDITFKSIVGSNTSITSKIARLFLISDILHNSSVHVTNAWRYRDGFQRRLPDIFEHLNGIYRSITARLKAEQFRRYITTVLGAWENWMVFPNHFIAKLDNLFTQKQSNLASSEHASTMHTDRHDGIEATGDSQPMKTDLDGDDMYDGQAMADLDGEPMDDIDGEAIE
ncbi:hypothetical protein BC941DRAFT_426267 [Chlamydoabsidia padenii]|nr:hypothetical protein BC941DRAFT_426267 [Chlamydoabsidia padenii]